jgi:hypothetical protein
MSRTRTKARAGASSMHSTSTAIFCGG